VNYYILPTLESDEDEWCYIDTNPTGLEMEDYYLRRGIPFDDKWPDQVTMKMSDSEGGTEIPTQIYNTNGFLILHQMVVSLIQSVCKEDIEYLPFILFNHEAEISSKEHFIINPIGQFDCLDYDKSDIKYFKDEILDIDYFIFDKEKFKDAPDLFRVKDAPHVYVISDRIRDLLAGKGFTNMYAEDIDMD